MNAWKDRSARKLTRCLPSFVLFWFCTARQTLQISINWNLPWAVDLLLWPAYLLEGFLKWSVTWMDVPAQTA